MKAAVEAKRLTHRYGSVNALLDVDLVVPEGAVYALLGPNGAGKTTLLQILMGLRRPTAGRVSLLGKEISRLTLHDRALIGYVAEGQPLPGWMTLEQLEAYLAPLYSTWDKGLADELRRRFHLNPQRKIRTLSRGEHMKATLLCTLAPRPRLVLMDEPFTGMDALVKDELVRGLLESAGNEGWTVLISSHDLDELEALADWVGYLHGGKLRLSEPMEALRERFKRVDVLIADGPSPRPAELPADWLSVEHSGQRLSFLFPSGNGSEHDELQGWFPNAARIDVQSASLREIFVGMARGTADTSHLEEVAR
jgi:ABC-2 type transport system ATP-binding protein